MEGKECLRYLTLAWLLWCGTGLLYAQLDPKLTVYRAYVSDRMEDWDRILMDMAGRKDNLTDDQLLDLVNYFYGYIGWAIGQGMERKARDYINEADPLIDELLEKYPGMPDLYAYKGAFLGFRIGLNKIKAVVLGPESMKHINHAIEIGPERPQGWIEKGNALYYMPKMFGGSKEKALQAYERAVGLMEKDTGMISGNWMYLNVLTILGQSYEVTGQWQKAKTTYEKALQKEPAFTYVRDELYPAFLKKWDARQ
jgi:tetratricopeptide (TPR) repeat protein